MSIDNSEPAWLTTLIVTAVPLIYSLVTLSVAVYVLILLRRLVRGTERIAAAIESGATANGAPVDQTNAG